jgi:IPT/TIG domain/Bacterial Ig-like domain (group 3)
MRGSGIRRPSGRSGRLSLAVVLVVAVLVGAATASARRSGSADLAAVQQHAAGQAGTVHYGKPVKARKVHAPKGLHKGQPSVRGKQDPDAQPPPGFGGGKAKNGLPPVMSDNRPGHKNLSLGPLTASGSFADLLSFTGATFSNTCVVQPDGSCSGSEPPDTQMAAGQNEIVEDVNNNLFVFSRSGTLITSYPLTTIFQPPNTTVGVTDPKIVFDPTTGNYYATEMVCQNAGCGANNYTHMGISLAISSNPAVGWTVYDYLNDGQNLQDQEKLGFSGDKITFAVNEYNCKCGAGNQYLQENIVVVQKSDAVAGNSITPAIFNDASNNSNSTYIFDSMPTTPVNASTSDNTQYVVWDWQGTSNNFMRLVRITGTPNQGNVDFTGNATTIGIANQTAPPTPVAQGGNLAGDKQNFQSAMVQGNDLWAVATDGCTPQGDNATRDCTRLIEVNLGNNSVVTDTDVGTTGTYRINPSVSKDGPGHVFFGFTISSASTYATAAIDGSALPLPAVLQRINFASGDATYTGGRWGDYSGTQQDPANTNDVWSAQEFGACISGCNNFNFGGNWATSIGQFTFRDPHITSISPNHGPATGGTTVDIYGSEFANGGTTVTFGSNTAPSVTWIDSTHIRAVSPPGDSGTVDITATTGAGSSDNSSSDDFTYNPVLTSVVPNNGPDTGGQSVTISGAGLNGATAVSFGGTPAASFTPVSSSTVTAVTPAHAGGTVDLTVTTSGGGTSNAIAYTFQFSTTTALASSANPSIIGAPVTFTATVSPVPNGGTISFSDNASPIAGCQSLLVNTTTGQATCTVTYGSVGSHSIVAVYSGNFFYLGSTSPTLIQQVTYMIVALYDQTRVINSGANVPIKVALQDAFGNNVSSASIVVTVAGLSPSPAPGTPPSGPFSFVTFDTGPGYLLNVKTRHYPAGTYTLSFTATGDPVIHTVQFILR